MSGRIEHLPAGAELTDAEGFQALFDDVQAARLDEAKGSSWQRPTPSAAAPRPPRAPAKAAPRAAVKARTRAPERPTPVPESQPAPPSPSAAAALEAEIDRCRSRGHVPRLAVHLSRAYASAVACFAVHRDVIEGEYAEGLGEDARVDAMLFPADTPGLFADVVASGEGYRGVPPSGDDMGRRVLRVLGRSHVREIAVLPIVLRGRVVSLLYADNGPEVLSDASAAALGAVCQRVSETYARLILERKRS